MAVRLPPFTALRALEAAARLQSYSRAAEALNVTHGAVSQQIRSLEEAFGQVLFRREGNRMVPTEACLRLAARVADATRILERGVEEVASERSARTLVLSTISSVAGRWLAPRLHAFAEALPDVRLEVRTEDHLANFVTDGIDLAIRYGGGAWRGTASCLLMRQRVFPVASPAFLERHTIATPADLFRVPLLRHREPHWELWCRSIGLQVDEAALGRGMAFNDSSLLIDAAVQGVGVTIARGELAEGELAAGRLVRLFEQEVEGDDSGFGYYLVWRPDSRKLAVIERFRDWAVSEMAAPSGAISPA